MSRVKTAVERTEDLTNLNTLLLSVIAMNRTCLDHSAWKSFNRDREDSFVSFNFCDKWSILISKNSIKWKLKHLRNWIWHPQSFQGMVVGAMLFDDVHPLQNQVIKANAAIYANETQFNIFIDFRRDWRLQLGSLREWRLLGGMLLFSWRLQWIKSKPNLNTCSRLHHNRHIALSCSYRTQLKASKLYTNIPSILK